MTLKITLKKEKKIKKVIYIVLFFLYENYVLKNVELTNLNPNILALEFQPKPVMVCLLGS